MAYRYSGNQPASAKQPCSTNDFMTAGTPKQLVKVVGFGRNLVEVDLILGSGLEYIKGRKEAINQRMPKSNP